MACWLNATIILYLCIPMVDFKQSSHCSSLAASGKSWHDGKTGATHSYTYMTQSNCQHNIFCTPFPYMYTAPNQMCTVTNQGLTLLTAATQSDSLSLSCNILVSTNQNFVASLCDKEISLSHRTFSSCPCQIYQAWRHPQKHVPHPFKIVPLICITYIWQVHRCSEAFICAYKAEPAEGFNVLRFKAFINHTKCLEELTSSHKLVDLSIT